MRCGSCHREHNRPQQLLAGASTRCADCHGFDSLATGHPAFEHFPTPERPRIMFDHATHQAKHFSDTERAFACNDCHQLDAGGQHQLLRSFESMCVDCHGAKPSTAPSKIFHHGDQIASADPFAFLTLPRIDLRTLASAEQLGSWPEGTRKGSRSGLIRLGITPMTGLLLAADARVAAALHRLKQGKTKLSSLKRASENDIADVVTLLWGIRALLLDMTEGVEQTLAQRLNPLLDKSLHEAGTHCFNGPDARRICPRCHVALVPGRQHTRNT